MSPKAGRTSKRVAQNARPGWNPVRRNKNIGSAAQGYGQNNEMSIPSSWHRDTYVPYWVKLDSYVLVHRRIANKDQIFLVEPPQSGQFYPCTVDDIARVLAHCPPENLASFDFLVLRQPTQKEDLLECCWGRAVHYCEIGAHKGSAILIHARSLQSYMRSKSLSPERAREIERLKNDGHTLRIGKRKIEVTPTPESMRNTVLYRTLLHEIGHHVDFGRTDIDCWDSKISREKEDFAHRYADEVGAELIAAGHLPFAQIIDEVSFARDGLKREWFIPNKPVA